VTDTQKHPETYVVSLSTVSHSSNIGPGLGDNDKPRVHEPALVVDVQWSRA
jgi:hypothetical protein